MTPYLFGHSELACLCLTKSATARAYQHLGKQKRRQREGAGETSDSVETGSGNQTPFSGAVAEEDD